MVFQHYAELLTSHRWQILLIVAITTTAFAFNSYRELRDSPEYTAAANVVMLPTEAELAFSQADAGWREAARTMSETYIEYVKSRPVVEAALDRVREISGSTDEESEEPITIVGDEGIVDRLKAFVDKTKRLLVEIDTGTYVEIPDHEREIESVQNAISVGNVANTHILRIEVTLPEPESAALMANTLAEAYVDRISDQLNADANELESYLQTQVANREAELQSLRNQQLQIIERYGPLGDTSAVQDQMRVVEAQLAELHSRLLTINLSRASASTQVRMIEPAITPVYPSSPGVVRMTALGLFIGVLLALASIIIRDAVSSRIKTSSDLRRLVGVRSIGRLKRHWVSRRRVGALRRVGLQFEQYAAALGRNMTRAVPRQENLSLAAPAMEGEIVAQEDVVAANSDHAIVTAIGKIQKQERSVPRFERPDQKMLVTGFAPLDKLCWATIGISAALASMGNSVYCRLPEGQLRRTPKFRFKNGGKLVYDDPKTTDETFEYLTVECSEPMNAAGAANDGGSASHLVCVVPRDEIDEDVVEAMHDRYAGKGSTDVCFVLMSA